MTKIDIVSGFLGAGEDHAHQAPAGGRPWGEQVVLIENGFGRSASTGGSSRKPASW